RARKRWRRARAVVYDRGMRRTWLLAVAVVTLFPARANAGPASEDPQLCRAERKGCAPALSACLAEARSAAREARRVCTTASCRREARATRPPVAGGSPARRPRAPAAA